MRTNFYNQTIFNCSILFFLFIGCTRVNENAQIRRWEILALEKQVDELEIQNERLSIILRKMESNHVSIRLFTAGLIEDIERIKYGIIQYALDGEEPKTGRTDPRFMRRARGSYFPRTVTFGNNEIPRKLTRMVLKCLSEFDAHPSTKGTSLDSFISELGEENPHAVIQSQLFDGLNVGQTVQLLELVQIRILMDENRYLTSQFDNAINRLILYGMKDLAN